MELDPILAVEDSGLPMMMPAADKNNNNPIEGSSAPSSSSIPRDEDPVTAVLGSGSAAASTNMKSTVPEKPAASATVAPSTPTRSASSVEASNNTEDLSTTLSNLLLSNTIPQSTTSALQQILRENATLKEKNSKLKSLLGRSAKAQRDAKQELEQLKKRYEEISRTNERLEHRIEVLANRPTHMDLLADFETNFDRALLAIGTSNKEQKKNSQSGGEDAAERRASLDEEDEDEAITAAAAEAAANSLYEEMNRSTTSNTSMYNNRRLSSSANSNNNSTLLLAELTEAKSRITHLESLNTTLQTRCTHLEHTHNALFNEHTHTKNQITNLQLELRMSKMETDHAQRSLREKEAMVQEMQLEINLVTNSAVEANKRAAEGLEVAQSVKMDKEYVDGLEAKVVALQDWALASTESKQLMSERCRGLEGRVKELTSMVELLQKQRSISQRKNSGDGEGGGSGEEEGMICLEDGTTLEDLIPLKKVGSSGSSLASTTGGAGAGERILWTKSSSLVVGAGMVGQAFIELGSVQIESYETVTLRWKFDLTRDEEDIYFSILKGICEEKRKQRNADACFRNRHVKGGGGGDVSGAFAVQNACTLVWSNEMSWFRPKTIKWTVEAVAIEWSD